MNRNKVGALAGAITLVATIGAIAVGQSAAAHHPEVSVNTECHQDGSWTATFTFRADATRGYLWNINGGGLAGAIPDSQPFVVVHVNENYVNSDHLDSGTATWWNNGQVVATDAGRGATAYRPDNCEEPVVTTTEPPVETTEPPVETTTPDTEPPASTEPVESTVPDTEPPTTALPPDTTLPEGTTPDTTPEVTIDTLPPVDTGPSVTVEPGPPPSTDEVDSVPDSAPPTTEACVGFDPADESTWDGCVLAETL